MRVGMMIWAPAIVVDAFLLELQKACQYTPERLERFLFETQKRNELFTQVEFSLGNEAAEQEFYGFMRKGFLWIDGACYFDSTKMSEQEIRATFSALNHVTMCHRKIQVS